MQQQLNNGQQQYAIFRSIVKVNSTDRNAFWLEEIQNYINSIEIICDTIPDRSSIYPHRMNTDLKTIIIKE
jgi:hypothetical protein